MRVLAVAAVLLLLVLVFEIEDAVASKGKGKHGHGKHKTKSKSKSHSHEDYRPVVTRGPPGQKGERGPLGPKGPPGTNGVRGARGLKGERGPIGRQGQRGRRGFRGQPGQAGLPGIPGIDGQDGVCDCRVREMVVAFTVEKSGVTRPRDYYQQLTFDTVVTLQGRGLVATNSSMIFVAPVTGLYIFSVTVIAEGDSATPVELFLNRVSIGSSGRRSSQSTGSYPTGSINLNLVLNKDDVISVMARPLNNGIVGFVTGLVSDPSDVIFTGYLQQVIYQ